MKLLPKARISETVEKDLDKELLIYDLKSNKAYALNETSKIIFKACDGKRTFDELRREYKFTDDLIYFALDQLKANDLIEDYQSNHFAGLSRRETIKKIGLGSMIALPVISGLVAPTAAHAASFCPPASSNIASGCPAGTSGYFEHNCNPAYDPERNSFCMPFSNRCRSRAVRYGGTCVDDPSGSGYRHNCVCR